MGCGLGTLEPQTLHQSFTNKHLELFANIHKYWRRVPIAEDGLAGCFLIEITHFHVWVLSLHHWRKGKHTPKRKATSWVCSYRGRPMNKSPFTMTRT